VNLKKNRADVDVTWQGANLEGTSQGIKHDTHSTFTDYVISHGPNCFKLHRFLTAPPTLVVVE
jgi:hypothetical protein